MYKCIKRIQNARVCISYTKESKQPTAAILKGLPPVRFFFLLFFSGAHSTVNHSRPRGVDRRNIILAGEHSPLPPYPRQCVYLHALSPPPPLHRGPETNVFRIKPPPPPRAPSYRSVSNLSLSKNITYYTQARGDPRGRDCNYSTYAYLISRTHVS